MRYNSKLNHLQEYLSQVLHQVDDMSLCHCFVYIEYGDYDRLGGELVVMTYPG